MKQEEAGACEQRSETLRAGAALAALAALALAGGCGESHPPGDGGADRRMVEIGDGAADAGEGGSRPVEPPPSLAGAPLDVLFVIDNSGSMAEEQTELARQLPRFVRSLAAGELRDRDSGEVILRFDPVDDLHLGVVSTDMGTGGQPLDTCSDAELGDDGVLLTRVAPECDPDAPRPTFLSFGAGDDPDEFAYRAACRVRLGTFGCGFEQQLEAALKALLPAGAETSLGLDPFYRGTGHADRENEGFLRDDSILLVVLLTDEDDCSARNPRLFDPEAFGGPANLNVRCFEHADQLHAVERYVQGLGWLRRDDPRRLVFAAIAGIPPGTGSTAAGPTDWDRIACTPERAAAGTCDERLRPEVVMTRMGQQLRPSCDVPGRGLAYPPNRIMRVAELLEARGAQAIAGSICDALDVPMDVVVRRIAALRR